MQGVLGLAACWCQPDREPASQKHAADAAHLSTPGYRYWCLRRRFLLRSLGDAWAQGVLQALSEGCPGVHDLICLLHASTPPQDVDACKKLITIHQLIGQAPSDLPSFRCWAKRSLWGGRARMRTSAGCS